MKHFCNFGRIEHRSLAEIQYNVSTLTNCKQIVVFALIYYFEKLSESLNVILGALIVFCSFQTCSVTGSTILHLAITLTLL